MEEIAWSYIKFSGGLFAVLLMAGWLRWRLRARTEEEQRAMAELQPFAEVVTRGRSGAPVRRQA